MTAPEVRAGLEFRVAGRTLCGTVLRYGDISAEHRECFVPGAFAPLPEVPLNLKRDRWMLLVFDSRKIKYIGSQWVIGHRKNLGTTYQCSMQFKTAGLKDLGQ